MVLRIHRLSSFFFRKKMFFLAKVCWAFNRIIFCCDISPRVKVGIGVKLYHNALACVIHPDAVIGDGCKIYQGVTIGGNGRLEGNGAANIGKNVFVGAGAILLGPIQVGAGAVIAAGAVVINDVPPHVVVAGNPAKIIKKVDRVY